MAGEHGGDRAFELIEATVRQDTDVLVLGEIRNRMTMAAAEKMAEQGKVVISTLHAASVVGVHARLVGIGMAPALLSLPGFFRGAVAQRLVPLLCPGCALAEPPWSRRKDWLRLQRLIEQVEGGRGPQKSASTIPRAVKPVCLPATVAGRWWLK